MSPPFYTISRRGAPSDAPTVVLEGELDLAARPELAACFETVVATGATTVNVDLAGVSFIDSAALGVLVDVFRALRDRDGRLVVTAASAFAARTIDIAGLAPYLLPPDSKAAPPAGPDRPDPRISALGSG